MKINTFPSRNMEPMQHEFGTQDGMYMFPGLRVFPQPQLKKDPGRRHQTCHLMDMSILAPFHSREFLAVLSLADDFLSINHIFKLDRVEEDRFLVQSMVFFRPLEEKKLQYVLGWEMNFCLRHTKSHAYKPSCTMTIFKKCKGHSHHLQRNSKVNN